MSKICSGESKYDEAWNLVGRNELEIRSNIHDQKTSQDAKFSDAIVKFRNGDLDMALKQATALVDAGYDHAYSLLGAIYENEKSSGVATDFQKALFYYQKGVDTVGAVESWLGLGRLFYLGKGVQQDYQKAFEYYSTIAQDIDNPVAHLMLGKMYLNGEGTKINHAFAKRHLEAARKKGYVFAYTYLGTLCFREKHKLCGLMNRVHATWKAAILTLFHPRDPRLRRI